MPPMLLVFGLGGRDFFDNIILAFWHFILAFL
jgi:hypothetical protein